MDPYLFRLQNITTAQVNDGYDQWRDALVAVARLAGWQPRPAASRLSEANIVTGRGIAIGGFAASQTGVVAEIELNRKSGRIVPKRLYASQVAGLTVYLDGVKGQMEGNLVMGASRALREEVVFDRRRVTSLDWVTYPILRFKDAPAVATTIVQRPDLVPTGSGEPLQAPVAAAIANAFFDATGVRLREAPMTPGRVRAVLAAAGALTPRVSRRRALQCAPRPRWAATLSRWSPWISIAPSLIAPPAPQCRLRSLAAAPTSAAARPRRPSRPCRGGRLLAKTRTTPSFGARARPSAGASGGSRAGGRRHRSIDEPAVRHGLIVPCPVRRGRAAIPGARSNRHRALWLRRR